MDSPSTMESKTLHFADIVTVLQAILPYDLFPGYNRIFCLEFRNCHDGYLGVDTFVNFLRTASNNLPERSSIFERLVGQLAMRKVGDYDALSEWLRCV